MGRFADIMEDAAEKTNADLATEISSLTSLKGSDIERLFPTRADKENLARLLEIVGAATDENKKVTQLKKNIDDLAGVVVRLVKVIV
jgi:hypothetical protein